MTINKDLSAVQCPAFGQNICRCVCVCRPRGSILGLIKSIHLWMMVPSSWMKYIYNFSENANPYFEVKMSQ